MTDREKVIERLGRVSYYFKSLLVVGWQGDADIYREHKESVNMAISMLKEQEPVEPRFFVDVHNPAGAFRCGACGTRILVKHIDFYCPYCGRAVKWDE